MSSSHKFSDILFATTRTLDKLTSLFESVYPSTKTVVKVGAMGALGVGLSKSHRTSARSASHRAKISAMSNGLEKLISGMVNAIELQDTSIYTEWTGSDGVHKALYDGATIKFVDAVAPTNPTALAIPVFMYGISSINPYTPETKELVTQFLSGKGTLVERYETFLAANDAFYYEQNTHVPTEIRVEDGFDIEQIKSAVRTGNARHIDVLTPVRESLPAFSDFTLDIEVPDAPATGDPSTRFEACSKGDYVMDYRWDVERRQFIPRLDRLKGFVPNDTYYTMVDMIQHELTLVNDRLKEGVSGVEAIGNNYINVQFVGRPGTGKSTIADALGATFGLPVRVVAVSKHTEEDAFTGMTKVMEGGFSFVETPFLDAFKNGGIVVIEEFNLADPGVLMGALGQAIEKPFLLFEDGYREVRRHPLCVIIATMNTGTQGSREPSEAFTSRMPNVFLLDDPKDEEFIKILQKNSGCTARDAKKVHGIYKKVLTYLTGPSVNEDQVALSITLRSCLAALKQMSFGVPFKQAIKNSIIGTIAIKDIDLANKVYEDVVKSAKD